MSYAAISGKIIFGSPEQVTDVSGDSLVYRYRGLTSLLLTNRPAYNDAWGASGQYTVKTVRGPTQLDASTYSEMSVEVALLNITGSTQVTNNEWPVYETDWVAVEKSLFEHPAFSTFTVTQRSNLRAWMDEQSPTIKAALGFRTFDTAGNYVSTTTLGTSASPTNTEQDFAALYLQGVENYRDFNPVARKTSLFSGADKPTVSGIGAKIGGTPFTGVPSGYEWVKIGDSARKQGTGFTWTRTEEWQGVRKWRVDVDNIY